MAVTIARIYDEPAAATGFRVLVDRLWPRGISKERAALDEWLKEVAPSNELRAWFHHEEPLWPEFERRYRLELAENPALAELEELVAKHPDTTLLYGAKDPEHNQAVVLQRVLAERKPSTI